MSVNGSFLTTRPYVVGVAAWESFNAIVGNTMRDGINVDSITGNPAETVILGNVIDRGPLPAQPPGGQAGISIGAGRRTFVGGARSEDANRITGNAVGLWIRSAGIERTFLLGNVIRDNALAVDLARAASSVVQQNVVTGNRKAIAVSAPTNTLRRNSIHGNDGALDFSGVDVPPPVLQEVTLTSVRGTSCGGCVVEVYSDQGTQGAWYEGETRAGATGAFVFATSSVIRGPNVTATATDARGTTSLFSTPLPSARSPPARRAKVTGLGRSHPGSRRRI